MAFSILSRPPNDAFTLRLFFDLTKNLVDRADCIYMWSLYLDPTVETIDYFISKTEYHVINEKWHRENLDSKIQKDLIILGIKDHLTVGNFNPLTDQKPQSVEYLESLISSFSDKKFIIFTSLENLDHYLKLPNIISIIPWGGDITNQHSEYLNLNPVIDKNLNSKYNFINLNRNLRNHRLVLISLLFQKKLESNGLISFLKQSLVENSLDSLNWKIPRESISALDLEFDKIKDYQFSIREDADIYISPNNNVDNFKRRLSTYYKNSFIEIISETSFTEDCFLITEKTLNSIYGCNFPIWISSRGTVKFLRDMGLDVFDDIIDHSYDSIEDPFERINAALDMNTGILTKDPRSIWQANKHRFLANVEFVKYKMYDFYKNRAYTNFYEEMKKHDK